MHTDPEQELEYGAGTTTSTLDPSTQPGVVDVESHDARGRHRPARSELTFDPGRLRQPTGSAAPRTCRSRPSWRSPGRSPPSPSRSRSSRSPGARRGTTPRRAAGRRPAWLAALIARPRGADRAAGRRPRRLRLTAPSPPSSARTCSPTRSSASSTSGGGSGWSRLSLLFGPGVEGDQPGPHRSTSRSRRLSGERPGPRRLRATPSGWATGRRRSACSRSCGWSWSTPTRTELGPVRLWCAVYVALMLLGGALFGNGFYERADPFEVYSTPGREAVDLGAPRRRPAAGPQPAGEPRHGRGRARPGRRRRRCSSAARPSTRSGLHALGAVHAEHRRLGAPCSDNLALLGFCARRRPDLRRRHDGDRGRARHPAPRRCPTCSRTRSCRSSSATSSPTT